MAGKKGDNSKKAAGQARKADAAAGKAAAENAKKAAAEDAEWQKGAKSNAKKEAEAAKKAEQARKKAEKDALAAEEEKSLPSKPAPKKNKSAVAKPKQGSGLDQALKGLSVDDDEKKTLSATGLDDILDLFEVVGGAPIKVIKHPERKYPGALAAYQEKRLIQAHDEGLWRGLRLEQKKQKIAKEFKNHPDNPHTWLVVDHNASREQISAIVEEERARREAQLTHKD